eukprot:TRINITY_DN17797_c1_g1_i1.p4 TRINITY_DN17797_c1_g1~~TRINITY_DN17797_c1_g1_i1.p4  ORF type:complete len:386 (+),score=27.00 TRINITY_DN17797_c1_g1_i1:3537-4694(+)
MPESAFQPTDGSKYALAAWVFRAEKIVKECPRSAGQPPPAPTPLTLRALRKLSRPRLEERAHQLESFVRSLPPELRAQFTAEQAGGDSSDGAPRPASGDGQAAAAPFVIPGVGAEPDPEAHARRRVRPASVSAGALGAPRRRGWRGARSRSRFASSSGAVGGEGGSPPRSSGSTSPSPRAPASQARPPADSEAPPAWARDLLRRMERLEARAPAAGPPSEAPVQLGGGGTAARQDRARAGGSAHGTPAVAEPGLWTREAIEAALPSWEAAPASQHGPGVGILRALRALTPERGGAPDVPLAVLELQRALTLASAPSVPQPGGASAGTPARRPGHFVPGGRREPAFMEQGGQRLYVSSAGRAYDVSQPPAPMCCLQPVPLVLGVPA